MSQNGQKCVVRPTIGYWMSERKSQKINWSEFAHVCTNAGYELIKLDLDTPLENQGPFTVIVHKLTELIARKDEKAVALVKSVEEYLGNHKEIVVIDPIESVRILLDRYRTYDVIERSGLTDADTDIFTPSFVVLSSTDVKTNVEKLRSFQVSFPFVCKPYVAQGTTDCHKMAIIFNEDGVADCKPPCVAQSFVNHNAVLFKLYIVGEQYRVVERPSLKNFQACDGKTIFFDSHDVSKSDSSSSLNMLDEKDKNHVPVLNMEKAGKIVEKVQAALNIALFGIDVVVENNTGRHSIIDINIYPGYEGYPDFFKALMNCIERKVKKKANAVENGGNYGKTAVRNGGGVAKMDLDDSGFDTCDSSEERKYREAISLANIPHSGSFSK